ncbi:MAG TPA: hypothetical protein VD908_02035 [Cytophagales bacterium]|nr:hypothetical protein [Cytophagales bacterium]
MRYLAIIIILILLPDNSISQELEQITTFDSTSHKRIYKISKSDFQHIVLIENLDGTFNGKLVNTIWKVNRKEERTKLIQQTLKIPPYHVEELMNIGFINNIETLSDCEDVDGCVIGLDGTSISFNIRAPELDRNYWYWEPDNDHYQDSTITEIKNVRTILDEIDKRISLRTLYDSFTSDLPIGKYAYGGIIMTKK